MLRLGSAGWLAGCMQVIVSLFHCMVGGWSKPDFASLVLRRDKKETEKASGMTFFFSPRVNLFSREGGTRTLDPLFSGVYVHYRTY